MTAVAHSMPTDSARQATVDPVVDSATVSPLDYIRIERAIQFLDTHAREQPTLAEVAAHVGLSEFHFQRLFTRWAGISPKRFLQFRTAAEARALLRSRPSVLDATYEAGLSGPGRLHDLLVAVDAVTPGEDRALGAGLTISHGVHDSPFGECLIATTPRGVCALTFLGDVDRDEALDEAFDEVRQRWTRATLREDLTATGAIAERVFAPVRAAGPERPLGVLLKGTNFQLKVWEALLRVPPGRVTTYEEIAAAIGAPRAVRAVGAAVGKNPIAYLIPCHRVIRKTGAFGDYRWGAARKQVMLTRELALVGD